MARRGLEVEQPVPVADEVLVRVHAASVNAYDWTGKIAPAVERNYPLSEAAEAIRHLEVEHARAKVVVTV